MPEIPIPERVPLGPLRDYLQWLHTLHEEAGWPSSRELAKVLGVAHTTVTRLFKEHPSSPRLATRLAEHLYENPVRRVVRSERDWDDFHDRAACLLKEVTAWKRAQSPSGTSTDGSTPDDRPASGELLAYRPGLTLYCPVADRILSKGRTEWIPMHHDLATLGRAVTGYGDVDDWRADHPRRVDSLLVYFPTAHWSIDRLGLRINGVPVSSLADRFPQCREVAVLVERAHRCRSDVSWVTGPFADLASKLNASSMLTIVCHELGDSSATLHPMEEPLVARVLTFAYPEPPRDKAGHRWLRGTVMALGEAEAFNLRPEPYFFEHHSTAAR